MSDRDMTRIRFGGDGMYADQLNEYAEEVARLRSQVARLREALGNFGGPDDWNWEALGLKPGDLDPLDRDDA